MERIVDLILNVNLFDVLQVVFIYILFFAFAVTPELDRPKILQIKAKKKWLK